MCFFRQILSTNLTEYRLFIPKDIRHYCGEEAYIYIV